MKRVILDENLPQPLRLHLDEFEVVTVGYMGRSGIQNGELVLLADADFDVLVTGDKNLRYQQDLKGRTIAIVKVPYTRLDQLVEMLPSVLTAIRVRIPGAIYKHNNRWIVSSLKREIRGVITV